LIVVGILFNNILRWYPFPAGRSANDLSTLEDNYIGIVVNISLFSLVLLLLLFERSTFRVSWTSLLLFGYCLYIAIQTLFRDNQAMEALRSASWIAMLLSAERAGHYFGSSPERIRVFQSTVLLGLIFTTVLGLAVAMYMPGSVNWGLGYASEFTQSARGEFFFLWIPPVVTAALATDYIGRNNALDPRVRAVATVTLVIATILCGITLTRTYVFGIVLVVMIVLYGRTRYAWFAVIICGVLGCIAYPEVIFNLLASFRILLDPNADFSTGRFDLNKFLLDTYFQNPVFGTGAHEMRYRISTANTIGTTEHGYTSHLASYGSFAGLFFAYLFLAGWSAVKLVHDGRRFGKTQDSVNERALGIAAASLSIFTVLSGLVGLLGAASSFADWLGLIFVSMCATFSGAFSRRKRSTAAAS
jgi:hypothetical protein